MSLPIRAWVEKIIHEMETHWLSGKVKVPGAVVSKECHADSLQGHERVDLLEKIQE